MEEIKLTNEVGAPVCDNENSLTIGPRGIIAMEDLWLFEKMAHFNREVIPERRMHAKGSGAFGTFTCTKNIRHLSCASIFTQGEKTDLFVRFSTVGGERGAADAERDIRGFAIKFYTKEGNWDLVGNNTPTFFLRDALNFVGLNRAVKRNPHTNLHDPQNNWDFFTILPEALHQVTITMSDRGIPASFRNMDGFGSHTYSLYNSEGQRVFCKFHFLTMQGLKYLTDEEAAKIIAKDRDSNARDLFENIKKGNFPRWKMCIQVMTEKQAENHYENPFDITKGWDTDEFPLTEIGMLQLNRNPDNFFAQVEQAAFCPSHIVRGIGFSPDKLLQGRLISYTDSQRYRLGVNNNLLPVNRGKVPIKDNHRDGKMRFDDNYGNIVGYTPNSCGVWKGNKNYCPPKQEVCGKLWRFDPKDDPTDDPYRWPGKLYRSFDEGERQRLIENTLRSMGDIDFKLKYRHATRCFLADEDYGKRFCEAAGLNFSRVMALSKLSNDELIRETRLDSCAQ